MLAAGASWTAHVGQLATQAGEYARIVAAGTARWLGPAGMKVVTSAAKMVAYLGVAGAFAAKAAAQCEAQAASYVAAFFGVPQMPEMAENHTTHGVLEATNFMGINGVPIAINEEDYLVRMTGQAHATMAGYGTETMANLGALPTFSIPAPMVAPGFGLAGLAQSGFLAAAGAPQKISRDAVFAAVGAESMFSTATQQGGRLAATVGEGEQKARAIATAAGLAGQQAGQDGALNGAEGSQGMTQVMSSAQGMISSVPQQVGQMGSQLGQGPQGMAGQFQQLLQPFMQMVQNGGTGGYGLDATGAPVDQIGLTGASPLSNHPLLGGTGAGGGAGLLSGSAIPGSGGTTARTPMLASLSAASASSPAQSVDAAATVGGARAGAAPVGGGMPMGAAGAHDRSEGGTVDQLVAPGPLQFNDYVDELDEWPV
ncbi:PPE protein [Mycobacteroides abscessus subsp. abscessus]|nr:PPE protein [Mycobacteroides abscessus subsp. abscessus]